MCDEIEKSYAITTNADEGCSCTGLIERRLSEMSVVENCLNPTAKTVTIVNPNIGTSTNNYYYGVRKDDDDQVQILHGTEITAKRREDVRKQIDNVLREAYESIPLCTLPWVVEERDVSFQNYIQLQLESDGGQIIPQLDELFHNVSDKNARRILIESQPGFGKTTLAHKIVHDWANGEQYIKGFTFAILINLRYVKSETLKDEVAKVIDLENVTVDETWDVVNNEKSLLILDGLDEIGDKARDSVVDSLCGSKSKYKMTIVVTCRIDLFWQILHKVNSKFCGVSVRKKFYCKKIRVLGISDAHRSMFLDNFLQCNDKRRILQLLGNIIETRVETFKSPLLLMMMAYLLRDNVEITIKSTIDLYKQLGDYQQMMGN